MCVLPNNEPGSDRDNLHTCHMSVPHWSLVIVTQLCTQQLLDTISTVHYYTPCKTTYYLYMYFSSDFDQIIGHTRR